MDEVLLFRQDGAPPTFRFPDSSPELTAMAMLSLRYANIMPVFYAGSIGYTEFLNTREPLNKSPLCAVFASPKGARALRGRGLG